MGGGSGAEAGSQRLHFTTAACPPLLQKIVRHPSYNPRSLANDIAVLVLKRAARTKPVALAASNFALKPVDTQPATGDWLYAAGFGETEAGEPSFHLMCVL